MKNGTDTSCVMFLRHFIFLFSRGFWESHNTKCLHRKKTGKNFKIVKLFRIRNELIAINQ